MLDWLRIWFCSHIRRLIGGLRKPVLLELRDYFDGNGDPKCPHCGGTPHSIKRCMLCGQKFITEL